MHSAAGGGSRRREAAWQEAGRRWAGWVNQRVQGAAAGGPGTSGRGEVRRRAWQRDYVTRGEDSSMALCERGDGGRREAGRMGSHSFLG